MTNNKNTNVPKLRFKGFNAVWQVKKLGDVCEKESSSISANSVKNNNGKYKIYGASGILKKIDFYTQKNPYIAIIKDGSGVGRTSLCDKKSSVIGTLDIIKIKDKNILNFIFETINRINFTKYIVGGAIPHIYFKDYSKENIFSPKPKEQQKIADCLTSLDDLITAQTQKLDNLKTHKKGLMQTLFPATNTTTPELRFAEFSGDWNKEKLVELFTITSCKRVYSSEWKSEGVPFYRAREIVSIKKEEKISPLFISKALYEKNIKLSGSIKKGDLLITGVGTIGIPYLVKNNDKFYFKDGNIIWLKNNSGLIDSKFLYLLYENPYIQKQIDRMAGVGTVGTYTISNAKSTYAVFPNNLKEQQKIADCLTSLDDLITAQTQKITTLKTHKKGLMQNLFPAN